MLDHLQEWILSEVFLGYWMLLRIHRAFLCESILKHSMIFLGKMYHYFLVENHKWMKVYKDLTVDAKNISETQDIKKQRELFKSLSKNTYELIKVSKFTEPVYYQYCPMQDANWLSKESNIKNPYYGSQMLTCGKTVETIKQ